MSNSSRGRPLSRPLRITTDDGYALGAAVCEPFGPARATVVINGATAVPARFYQRFAEHLAGTGLRVLTYDYRGVGQSRPVQLRGFRATMSDWAEYDARAALARARALGPEPVILVGHSFGGQLLGLIDDARDVLGAVLVGSQLGTYRHWPWLDQLKLRAAFGLLAPALSAAFGYLPGEAGLGEDLPAGVVAEWSAWGHHSDYFMGQHPAARSRFARYDKPILFYSFTDDPYAPEPAVEHLISVLSRAPVAHRRLSPGEVGAESIGHFGFFRPAFADTLWRETHWFIEDLLSGRATFALRERRAPWHLSEEDVELDLAYGRA